MVASKKETAKARAVALAKAQIKAGATGRKITGGPDLDYRAIAEATGLPYGALWRAVVAGTMPTSERIVTTDANGMPLSDATLGARFAEARAAGQSWGYISMRSGVGEARVRSLFSAATGLNSKGLRIGRGGRFAAKRSDLYTGRDRNAKGTEVPMGTSLTQATPTNVRVLNRKVAAAVKKASKLTK